MDVLLKTKNYQRFWNIIKQSKKQDIVNGEITITDLQSFFAQKLSAAGASPDHLKLAEQCVEAHYRETKGSQTFEHFIFPENAIIDIKEAIKTELSQLLAIKKKEDLH